MKLTVSLLILGTLGGVIGFHLIRNKVRLELYDIQDLVFCSADFGTDLGDGPDFKAPEGFVTGCQFALQIKREVRPDYWGEKSRWSIRSGNGLLIVRAPSYVQEEVKQYLLSKHAHLRELDDVKKR